MDATPETLPIADSPSTRRREKLEVPFRIETLEALAPADPGRYYFAYDARCPGLALMVTGNGAKTFYVYRKHQGKPYQYRIGRFDTGAWKIELARQEARRVIGLLASGRDPKAEKKKASQEPTFGELFTWWLDTYARHHLKTWKGEQKRFERTLQGFANKKVTAITRGMVAALHAKLAEERGKHSANRTLELVRTVFNRAITLDRISMDNPAEGISRFKEEARSRRLNATEAPAFFHALNEEPNQTFRDFFLLALLTGMRKSNVQAMRWDQLNLEGGTWTISGSLMKNGRAHTLRLHPVALEVLRQRRLFVRGEWVLPGRGGIGHISNTFKAWRRLLECAGLADLRIHDLRRSLGSWMVDTGASLVLVGEALNHKTVAAAQIYARAAADPVEAARNKAIDAILTAANKADTQQED